MSEVLWEFLAPYTPLAPNREAMEKLLAMASAAWNVALFPGGERAQRLRELSTTLPAEARTDFLALIREMIARKERYFAQYTRYILNFSNNSPPPLIVTLTPLGYIAPRSKGTWYFPKVYGIIAKAVQCLSMCFNSLPYLHLYPSNPLSWSAHSPQDSVLDFGKNYVYISAALWNHRGHHVGGDDHAYYF